MNWLNFLTKLPLLTAYVVAGVQQIHKDAPTETKTQLALEALGIATQAATSTLSAADASIASAVSNLTGQMINVINLAQSGSATAGSTTAGSTAAGSTAASK